MPHKIILEEIIDEMLENISVIQLNTYIRIHKEGWKQSPFLILLRKILNQNQSI